MRVDVVVLGAGVAGLTAAAQLAKKRLTVAVLEARDAPGGRVRTVHVPGLEVPLELGAEFVHGRVRSFEKLLASANAKRRDADGSHWLRHDGRFERADATFEAAMSIFGGAPSEGVPVRSLIDQRTKPGSRERELTMSFAEGFYAADPNTASAAFIAEMAAASDRTKGDQMFRVLSGYDTLVAELVRSLGPRASLLLSTVATEVAWRKGHVTVQASRAFGPPLEVEANACVIALPQAVLALEPPAPGALRFTPEPPEVRANVRRLETFPILKFHFGFHEPPWAKTKRLPRSFAFLHPTGEPVPTWWRPLPFQAPMLVGWVGGPRARELTGRAPREQLEVALGSLARVLGQPEPALLEQLVFSRVTDWGAEPFARGGYVAVPAGAEDAQRRWSLPVEETLFFAGEARQRDGHAGTVHGAVDTGHDAAREVLASR